MAKNTRLELTWIGKDERPRLEPRILIEDTALSYHASAKRENDIFDHMLIHGDNLLALKALEANYRGRVGCIYIDPPYNTGNLFDSYDDNLEHSIWLSHIRDRIAVLWELLRESGTLLISINDDEAHYLKVLCDELLGRKAFKASLIWNTEGNTDNQSKIIRYHEYVLVYCKGELPAPGVVDPNIDESSKLNNREIRNTIVKNGSKNPPSIISMPIGFPCTIASGTIAPRTDKWPHVLDNIVIEDFKLKAPARVYSGWSSKDLCEEFIENRFTPIRDTKGQPTKFELTATGTIEGVKERGGEKGHFISVLRGFGTTNQMRLMLEKIGIKFTFPKPVGLLKYLIEAFSEEDDIILDSYAGSGTTAHAILDLNLGGHSRRKFILIEQFDANVRDVIQPRLRAVIDGDSRAELEAAGGGFHFYRLAPSLLATDKWGNWVISKSYNAPMLAEAICKLMGFTYAPSQDPAEYWRHGHSSERDFIYVTTASLTHDQLRSISEDVGSERTLLICCKAFNARATDFENLTIKKIPHAVLSRCEWGRDDYSLRIAALPDRDAEPAPPPDPAPKRRKARDDQPSFLDDGEA